jgi:hypothetical protein
LSSKVGRQADAAKGHWRALSIFDEPQRGCAALEEVPSMFSIFTVSKKRVYVAFLLLALGLSATPGGPQVPLLLWNLWHISRDPAETTGTVMNLDCYNHGHVDYVAEIGTSIIEGRQHNVADAECRNLRTGQRIGVAYERANPENNFAFARAGDGNRVAKEFYVELLSWTSFVFIGPLFFVLLWTIFSKVTGRTGN